MMIAIKEREFKQLADYMRSRYGIRLSKEKQALVTGRLQNVLVQKKFGSFSELYEYILSDTTGEAVRLLLDRITTNHTFFMREQEHFQYFRDTVLPYLIKAGADKDLRIWSAGCSSGEEPYTLAMILADYFGNEHIEWDTRILATDISDRAIQKAIKGIYSSEQLADLPGHWQKLYFQRSGEGQYCLQDRIRKELVIRKFNLMEPFPFKKKFHVIFCRNVMIYFDGKSKQEVVNKFYQYTEPGGYLFIGHAESLLGDGSLYRYIMPAVYRKE
jgi:chemotaxis protein methyltransferase CheR